MTNSVLHETLTFKSIRGKTPPGLVAALASFAWPPSFDSSFGDLKESNYLAYRLLVELGNCERAIGSNSDQAYWNEITAIKTHGLVRLTVARDERPGSLSAEALRRGLGYVVVPAGVGVGAAFHVPNHVVDTSAASASPSGSSEGSMSEVSSFCFLQSNSNLDGV